MNPKKLVTIIIADDDSEDRMMIREAFEDLRLTNPIVEVEDGEELMELLKGKGKYKSGASSFTPGLILLDLNMPRMDGREALKEIKNSPEFKRIPVVVLTTSKAEEDVVRSYDIGANSFIVKPISFAGFIDALKSVGKYWLEIVEIPGA